MKPNVLPVRIYGDETLIKISEHVEEINDELLEFIADLKETMYIKDGVGLAAPQVGVLKRIFVIDTEFARTNKKNPIVFINPEITQKDGIFIYEEGCLSLPGIFETVRRFENITVKAKNEKWQDFEMKVSDYVAVVIQHEFDHLNGVLFIDHLNRFKKIKISPILKRLKMTTDSEGINVDEYLIDNRRKR
ncbi:MAG: peptide deformylase [Candidatus Cloacimonetes bacterium]|nr:peptide deformylase [Candidatus Cloacimonadota bacterium]